MLLQIASTSLAGYAFARLKFKGSNIIFWILMIYPDHAPRKPLPYRDALLQQLRYFGYLQTLQRRQRHHDQRTGKDESSTSWPQPVRHQSFAFHISLPAVFRGMVELEESAQIDGASIFRTYWSVMLRMPASHGNGRTLCL